MVKSILSGIFNIPQFAIRTGFMQLIAGDSIYIGSNLSDPIFSKALNPTRPQVKIFAFFTRLWKYSDREDQLVVGGPLPPLTILYIEGVVPFLPYLFCESLHNTKFFFSFLFDLGTRFQFVST